MVLTQLVGREVLLYLEGGHTINAKVNNITDIETTDDCGGIVKQTSLMLYYNEHTTFVLWEKVVAVEVY